MGGNLCNASPAADSVPALIAARATVAVFGPDGSEFAVVMSAEESTEIYRVRTDGKGLRRLSL